MLPVGLEYGGKSLKRIEICGEDRKEYEGSEEGDLFDLSLSDGDNEIIWVDSGKGVVVAVDVIVWIPKATLNVTLGFAVQKEGRKGGRNEQTNERMHEQINERTNEGGQSEVKVGRKGRHLSLPPRSWESQCHTEARFPIQ